MTSYVIVRFHFDTAHPDHRRVIRRGLTLEEAQEHTNDESTHGDGWFDGYTDEDNYPPDPDADYDTRPWGEQQSQIDYLETRYDDDNYGESRYYGEDD